MSGERTTKQEMGAVGVRSSPVGNGAVAPPLGGGDIELGNFIQGGRYVSDTCTAAARAILNEVDGFSCDNGSLERVDRSDDGGHDATRSTTGSTTADSFDPQDWYRKFLAANGGCIYIDLGHAEVCLPEVTSARAFVAYWHAMLQIARQAQVAANARLPAGERVQVLVNNSDGRGHSYGAHLNFLIDRATFEDIASHRIHLLLYLASYQVSSIVFAGSGKVGSENDRAPAPFQLSQRADFFETVAGLQTTWRRPLVNLRDECLCGPRYGSWARLHVIFFDSNLCHVANFLKFGVMQIVLTMIAAGRADHGLILEDPLGALLAWSHDPTLARRASTLGGSEYTAVEHQLRFAEAARRFVDSGSCNVPEAPRILELWEDTLVKLEQRSWPALQPRLDWVLKLASLQRAREERPELGWDSPELKYLDHLYGSLDPGEGLFWCYDRAGLVQRLVEDAEIDRAMNEPPPDTRAFTRAMLLRRAEKYCVDAVDWDFIRFRMSSARGSSSRTLRMHDPIGLTRADTQSAFAAGTLEQTLDQLGVP